MWSYSVDVYITRVFFRWGNFLFRFLTVNLFDQCVEIDCTGCFSLTREFVESETIRTYSATEWSTFFMWFLFVCTTLLIKHWSVPRKFLSPSYHTLVVLLSYCSADPHVSQRLVPLSWHVPHSKTALLVFDVNQSQNFRVLHLRLTTIMFVSRLIHRHTGW